MKLLMKCAVACGLLLGASGAFAQEYVAGDATYGKAHPETSRAGEPITNTATVEYYINNILQDEEINDPAATFVVDRVILVNVATTDDPVDGVGTSASATEAVLTFTVTNDSNATIDLVLATFQSTSDDFNVTDLVVWQDDGDGIFQGAGTDTNLTASGMRISNVDMNTDVTVFVTGTIPSSLDVDEDDQSSIQLLATAHELGDVAIVEDDGDPDVQGTMETVFGDLAGVYDDGTITDGARDGRHSDSSFFVVGAATIAIVKNSVVVRDPFNLEVDPKAIPGAEVLYCIEIANSGLVDATDVTVSDGIPDGTTYVEDSIRVFVDDAPIGCTAAMEDTGGYAVTDDSGDAAAEETASSGLIGVEASGEFSGNTVITTVAELPNTDGHTVTVFRVTID